MECKETRDLCKKLSAKPISAVIYPLVAGTHAPPGWPDRFMALRWKEYRFAGHIEFKKATNGVTDLQERRIQDLLDRGSFACAVWLMDDDEYIVREYLPCGPLDYPRVCGLTELISVLSDIYGNFRREN